MKMPSVVGSVYWGWIVCWAFLILFTISAGVAFSFNELFVPISNEVDEKSSMLSTSSHATVTSQVGGNYI